MVILKKENGVISISKDVIAKIVGYVANRCFGVVGMASKNTADGIVSILKKEHLEKGVNVQVLENGLFLEIHIVVDYGYNIPAITDSIIHEVRYSLEKVTNFKVADVQVCVDSMHINK